MSRYRVLFDGEGDFVDRHARWFKVTVRRDGRSLGTALGVIDGRSWDSELPEPSSGLSASSVLSYAAVRLLAITVQDAVEAGVFRDGWEVAATEFALDARDARHLVNVGVADPDPFEPDAAVAFFEH
jgi:hypothetical protein